MPSPQDIYDLVIIGGGINGCGIARDAAGRGHSVLLCEQDDLGHGTSSASTKLIHGGLRYLEHYEFRLVREALIERERLLCAAPHIIWPMRFVLPHHASLRPRWLIRLGLFLYDHIGGRKLLPGTRSLNLSRDPAGTPLRDVFRHAFEYSDCWVDDARLVVLNAMDAAERGADIHVRTACIQAERRDGLWTVTLKRMSDSTSFQVQARVLVNAAGPWVGDVLSNRVQVDSRDKVRMVKGSHIVVPKMFDHDRAYIFQNPDERIVFTIPYEDDFTLIGTTDQDFTGDPNDAALSSAETAYLCEAISIYFKKPLSRDDIVWSYAGVRPLYDDGATAAQEATRDYVLRLDNGNHEAPLLTLFGGKITTYRRLAEEVLDELSSFLPARTGNWTETTSLPGGEFAFDAVSELTEKLRRSYAFLCENDAKRLIRAYGTKAYDVLGDARTIDDLGESFGAGLTAREIDYLMRHEWALTSEDVLWRRSKLGLHLSEDQRCRVDEWIRSQLANENQ